MELITHNIQWKLILCPIENDHHGTIRSTVTRLGLIIEIKILYYS